MKLFHRNKDISPTVTFLEIYKNVVINDEEDDIIAQSKINNTPIERSYKTVRWDDICSVELASMKTRKNLENKNAHYVQTFSNHRFTVELKDPAKFTDMWNKALKDYDLLRH